MVGIYNHSEGKHDINVNDDGAVVKAEGFESYQSGDYMNERNVTLDVHLTHEQILEAAEEIRGRKKDGEIDEEELACFREVETNPGYQVVIRTENGEYIQVGPNPWIFVGPMEDEE